MTEAADKTVFARVKTSFDAQTMLATLGANLVRAVRGEVAIAADAGPSFLQQQGYAHGGLVFTLADAAAGYAALTILPEDAEVMTVELKINYLAPARGRLVATGRVTRPGRRIVVVSADVISTGPDGVEKQVAILQGTMIPVSQ